MALVTTTTEDYYTVLKLVQTATTEQVIQSYRWLALKLHPDRNADPNATEAFQLVCQFSRTKVNFWVNIPLAVC
jgi:DnaJ-class molecular chaperone